MRQTRAMSVNPFQSSAGVITAGLYRRLARPVAADTAPRSGVFLDRDGVLVEEVGYLHRVEDVRFIEGALEAVVRLNRSGWPVILVTNQAGVGRGFYTWREFEAVQQRIEEELTQVGGWLDGVWACGSHPDSGDEPASGRRFRKPAPGMIEEAAAELRINLASSWLVGDKTLDIEAAVRGGLRGAVLAGTGYGTQMRPEVELRREQEWRAADIRFANSLAAAVDIILSAERA